MSQAFNNNPFGNVDQAFNIPSGTVQTQNMGSEDIMMQGFAQVANNQQSPFGNPQFQQQNQNNNFRNNNFRNNQQNQNNQQQKYNIIDLFWFANPKMNNLGNEMPFMIISYNADFNNLSLRFTNLSQMSVQTAYCVKDFQRISSVNLYSEHCIDLLNSPAGTTINIIERAFNINNWTPNQSTLFIDKDSIVVNSTDGRGQYTYTFSGNQYIGLRKAAEFMINGQCWNTHLIIRSHSM